MTYPATGRWPEPHSLWLSAAFLGDDDAGKNVIHMYPEERPGWCDIDRQGCDDQPLSYMGDDHVCEIPDDDDRAFTARLPARLATSAPFFSARAYCVSNNRCACASSLRRSRSRLSATWASSSAR